MKLKRTVLTGLLCLCLALVPALGMAQVMYVVTTHSDESIYMRSEPSYDQGEIVTAVPSGAAVNVVTVMADVPWIQAEYSGFTGYIALESLSETDPNANAVYIPATPLLPSGQVVRTMYVTSENGGGVHLRTSPSTDVDNVIETVPFGAPVGVILIMADVPWAEIEYDGTVGYMLMEFLSDTKPTHVASSGEVDEAHQTALEAMFEGFEAGGYEAKVVPASGETYVNMRWAPSLSAPVRIEYNADAVLWVSSYNDTWSEVYDAALDIHGYMESIFLHVE